LIFPTIDNPDLKGFYHEAIAVAYVRDIRAISVINLNDEKTTIKYEIRHTPYPCMYPHSEIMAIKNGNEVGRSKIPNGMKDQIRQEMSYIFKPLREVRLKFA